jgi:UTP--glucose-1-phosphate uridylyltransferase
VFNLTEFVEKPDAEYARCSLRVEGLPEDHFLTLFGLYVLTPRVFELIEEHIRHNIRERGEFQLTSCLDELRKEEGFSGVLIQGRRYDIGLPEAYRQTLIDYRNA